MTKSYNYLLEQNNIQVWYTENVFKRRNNKKDDVFGFKLTEFWDNANSDMTLEDLVYHAVEPLYKTCKLIVDESSKWEDLSLSRKDKQLNTESSIQLYQEVLDLAKKNLQNVDPNNLKGYFFDVNGNEKELIQRLAIVAYHATHHMAQMLRFHGLMCESLQNVDLLIETT